MGIEVGFFTFMAVVVIFIFICLLQGSETNLLAQNRNKQLYFRCSKRPKFIGWDKVYYCNGKVWLDEGHYPRHGMYETGMYLYKGGNNLPAMLATIRDSQYYWGNAPSQFAQMMQERLRGEYEIIVSFPGREDNFNVQFVVEFIKKSLTLGCKGGYSWDRTGILLLP